MDFIVQACYKCVICFDKQSYKLFEDVNSDIINGISTERSQIANNQKLTKVKLDNIAPKELEITEIQEILSRGKIYERFNISSIFSNVSDMTSHRKSKVVEEEDDIFICEQCSVMTARFTVKLMMILCAILNKAALILNDLYDTT